MDLLFESPEGREKLERFVQKTISSKLNPRLTYSDCGNYVSVWISCGTHGCDFSLSTLDNHLYDGGPWKEIVFGECITAVGSLFVSAMIADVRYKDE